MFEPIHGSAFDITGKGTLIRLQLFDRRANAGTFGSARGSCASDAGVEQVCNAGIMTPDVGGTATTIEVTQAVVEAIRIANS